LQENMNKIVEKKGNIRDIITWLAILVITLAAFYCNYSYTFSGSIRAIVWICWFIIIVLLAYITTKGQQVFEFAQEAKVELLKVVWPTRQEAIQTTTIVMVMVAATGFILWLLDSVIMWVIAKITHLG